MTFRGASMQQLVVTCLVIAGLAFPLEAAFLLWAILGLAFLWILIGAAYFILKDIYRGFRYGEWMEA